MATLDDSPSLFSGESWSTWAEYVHQNEVTKESTDTSCNENKSKDESDSMKLRREDMVLYGLCPAQDELFLAVCEDCGQVVKPQALQRHIEIRHGQKSPSSKKKSPGHSKGHGRSHKSSKQSPAKSLEKSCSNNQTEQSEHIKNHSFPVVKVERIRPNVFAKQQSTSVPSPHECKFEENRLPYKNESYHYSGDFKETSEMKHFDNTLVKEEPMFKDEMKSYKDEPGGHEEVCDNNIKTESVICDEKLDNKRSENSQAVIFPDIQADINLSEKESCKSENAEFVDSLFSKSVHESSSNKQERGVFREALFSSRHREFVGEDKTIKPTTKLTVFNENEKSLSKKFKSEQEYKENTNKKDGSHSREKSRKSDNKCREKSSSQKKEKDSRTWQHDFASKSMKSSDNEKKHKTNSQNKVYTGLLEKETNNLEKDSPSKKKHSSKRSKSFQDHKPHNKKHSSHKGNNEAKKKVKTESESFVSHVSDSYNQMYFISNIKEEKNDSPISVLPESVEELTRKAEPPVPEMVDEAATAVEALNSQELVDKFEKMETDIQAQIEIKHKIKVQDGTHIFQIDNRSSTPVLHIPSPKSEPPTTPPPMSVAETAPSLISLNGSISVPNSKSSSRANSRPPSRQHSQPSTPLVNKSDTILLEDLNAHLSKLSSIQDAGFGNAIVKPIVTTVSSTLSAITPVKTVSSSGSKKTTKGEKFIPCKDRIYDPEKHCGVWIVDQGRHCTRSLTCKTHSLSLRRAVEGRSKSFDQLLQEHRDAKEALLKAKAAASSNTTPNTTDIPKVNRISMATKTVTMTTSSNVISHSASIKLAQQQIAVVKQPQPVPNLLPFSRTIKPAVLSVFGQTEPLPIIETGGQLSSEGEEEEDELETTSILPKHPRPAAVNNWGSRQYGRGCYMFNQRCDLLRSAFSSMVEVHNQAPPQKRQCLESRQNQELGGSIQFSKDPYDFTYGDKNGNVIQTLPGGHYQQSSTIFSKQKSKQNVNPVNKSVKHKEHVLGNKSLNSSSKVSGSANLKRKRSGSGHSLTSPPPNCTSVNLTTLSSPISITIPAGINIASLGNAALNTISAHLVPAKNTSTAQLHQQPGKANNINFVVSGDQPQQANIVNGQLLNLPGNISLDVSQLSNLTTLDRGQKSSATKGTAKLLPNLHNKSVSYTSTGKTVNQQQSLQLDLTGSNSVTAGHIVTALPTGTVLMDTTGHTGQSAGTFLTSSQVALTTTATSNNNPSSATGFVFKKDGQLANGVLPHSGGLQLKNLPISINHLNSSDQQQTPSPPTAITLSTDQRQLASKIPGRNHSIPGPRVSSLSKTLTATLKPAVQTQIPLSAATLNLGPQSGGRYIAPAGLQQVINPLQIQATKAGSKATTKMIHPMSLTIVAPPGGIAGLTSSQTRPLLINSETNSGKPELSDVVSSPASVT